MSRVLLYVRVSTDEQRESGLGLAAQRDTLTALAARKGWTDVEWIEDAGFSAGSLGRPGIQRALDMLARGQADALVVARLDRLSRSLLDFAGLMDTARRQGWSIVAADLGVDMTEPAGEMLASVLAAFAQYERALISKRTREAMNAAKARGVRLGGPITTPAAVRERVVAAAASGYSHAAIARALNADGVPTASGGTWHRSGVRRVLHSHALDLHALELRGTPPTVATRCGSRPSPPR